MAVVYTCSPLPWLEWYQPALTVGSGVVLCGRQGEMYVGLVFHTGHQASKLKNHPVRQQDVLFFTM